MPGNLLDADTGFPEMRGSQEQINRDVQNYLYMLLEQLRYTLSNLGADNFNDTELDGIANVIREPVLLKLEAEDGRLTALAADTDGLRARLSSAEGDITELSAQAEGVVGRLTDAEGKLNEFTVMAEGFAGRLTDAEGNITDLLATSNGLSATVSGLDGKYTNLQLMVDGFTIKDEAGKVWINNGNINLTGAITWGDLNSSVQSSINDRGVSASTVHTLIKQDLVASPNIAGGKFLNLDQDVWIEMANRKTSIVQAGLELRSTTWDGVIRDPIFGVYDADFNDASFEAKGVLFLMVSKDYDAAQPYGKWDFSQATVTGLRIA